MAYVTWYGHAAFKFEIADKVIFVDPMLNQSPTSPIKASGIKEADVVYVTHDHPDHLGDAFEVCKNTGAAFAAVYELAEYAFSSGVENVARLNVGGSISFNGVKLTVVQAVHSSTRGTPTGVMIEGEGLTIYHAGDTALFGDMKLLSERRAIDLACIPVGGNYTMDAEEAAIAVRMLKPRMVFPMHFGTFSKPARSPTEFAGRVKARMPNVRVISLRPGESFELGHEKLNVLA